MIRAVFVCIALLAVALLISGCAAGSLSEAEQQSLAAAATAARKACSRVTKLESPYSGKTSSAVTTSSIRVVKSHCRSPAPLRR